MAWTKVYWCPRGNANRSSVTAKLVGPEIVGPTDWYSLVVNNNPPGGSPAWTWSPGVKTAIGTNTQLRFPSVLGNQLTGTQAGIFIGWRTADNFCVLYDLRWDATSVVDAQWQSGVPGGGMALYEEAGEKLTVAIINDYQSRGQIDLGDVLCTLFDPALPLPESGSLGGPVLTHRWAALFSASGHPPAPGPGHTPVCKLLDLTKTTLPALDRLIAPIPFLRYSLVPWPANPVSNFLLDPGQYTAFDLTPVPPTSGFVMFRAARFDANSLAWAEQITPRAG